MDLKTLEFRLNNFLSPDSFHDFCPNGLIVQAPFSKDFPVSRIVTGVSLRDALIDRAVAEKADVIIVHHPNGWWCSEKDKKILDSNFANYTRRLMRQGVSLFGYHLPLDANVLVGNNATVYNKLGLSGNKVDEDWPSKKLPECFGHDGIVYGGTGVITDELLDKVFPKGCQKINFMSGKRYRVAVCTGSGSSEMEEAARLGYDMFVTGEIRESTPIFAEEHRMAVVAAGHHRSEVFCVQNLADWINKNCPDVKAKFIDIDNPV